MDFLRDPVWQFIGVIIALIALYFTIAIPIQQRNRKELIYEIISNTSLSSFKLSNKVKMSILFAGRHLKDVNLIYLKLWNNGNIEIEPSDYIDPIIFDFGHDVKVLEAIAVETEPKDIMDKILIKSNMHKIILDPLLLNKKDYIKLKILLERFTGKISVSTRIKGIKEIKNLEETNLSSSGYMRSIGWGFKDILSSSPGLRYLLIVHIAVIPIIILLSNIFTWNEISKFFAYGEIFLLPFVLGMFLFGLAIIGLSTKKVRYNIWLILLISFIIPIILYIVIIYSMISH